MGLVNGWRRTDMPIDIYRTHPWFMNKGKIPAPQEQDSTRSQHFGLLKSYMPLPRNDIAVSNVPYLHVKSSEYSTFDSESKVIQNCFQQLVQTYSNSISGVLLMQLRLLAKRKQDYSESKFTKSLANFIQLVRLLISSSLFYSGGHSLYEYAFVLTIPEIQEAFKTIPGFDSLDLENLFYLGNETAFDAALNTTLKYSSHFLTRKALLQELNQKLRQQLRAIPQCNQDNLNKKAAEQTLKQCCVFWRNQSSQVSILEPVLSTGNQYT
jgi:hypothetical protein